MEISTIINRMENGVRGLMGRPQVLYTPYGKLQLAGKHKTQARQLLAQLQRTTEALTKGDIQKWRQAWQRAISVESPNRQMLYDIYRDAMVDAHLSGCIDQRTGFVMARSFNIEDRKGTPQNELHHYFEQEWFDDFCRLVLTTPYWGHSLIELGNLAEDGDGCLSYDGVHLIDRRYVIPEHHRVIIDLGQDWTTGIDYHDPKWSDNLVEVGQPDDLGLLLKAAQHTIPKKNVLAAWDVFGEIFGMPLRIAKTSARDQKDIDRIDEMMNRLGLAGHATLPLGTEIQFLETGKSDAFNVYDKRVDRANSELSKLVIGQTMTIEDGSSLSQSQTHLKVFENLVESDAKLLANTINNQLLPRMERHGFPVGGMVFTWDKSIDYTPEQQMEYEKMVADRYEVDPKYFADKYNMPVGQRLSQMSPMAQTADDDNKSVKSEKSVGGKDTPSASDDDNKSAKSAKSARDKASASSHSFFD